MTAEIGKIKNNKETRVITDYLVKFDKIFLDNFSKLAILTILAGYNKCNNIYVNDFFSKKIKLRELNSFISYILNHKISPMKFQVKIRQNSAINHNASVIDRQNNHDLKTIKSILSFSGGLDSTAGLLYALDKKIKVLPLWIDFGQRNNRAEYKAVKRVTGRLKIQPLIIRLDLKKDILKGWKDWNFIIPGRNFLFLSLANSILRFSNITNKTIYLCAHKDEMGFIKNRDKSKHFFKKASLLFSLASGQKIKSFSPFQKYSKSEVISYWRRKWEKKYNLSPLETSSCYYGDACGKCDACIKRAVYLLAGGYDLAPSTKIHPLKDGAGLIKNSWLPRIKSGKMSRNNKLDFLIAVEKSINIIPDYICLFFQNLSPNTLRTMKKRKLEISNSIIR